MCPEFKLAVGRNAFFPWFLWEFSGCFPASKINTVHHNKFFISFLLCTQKIFLNIIFLNSRESFIKLPLEGVAIYSGTFEVEGGGGD